jgi:hypothetical protein
MLVLSRRLAQPRVALLATALIACCAFQVWYAQQVRMYALVTLAMLIAVYALVPAWQQPDGSLQRPAGLREAAALLRIALAGVPLLQSQGQASGLSVAEIERVLRAGSESQRARAVAALRQLQGLVREIAGEG